MPDRSQLKKENKSVLLLSHPVARGKNPGNQNYQSVSSVAQSCPTLCDPMNRSMPGLPVHHQLPESTQTHVHCVGESALRIRWPKYWSFRFSISPTNDHPGLISLGWTGWISLQSKGLYYLSNVRHQASQVALVVKNLSANAGDKRDPGSIPGLGRSPGGRHSNPFQYSCLENPMDRGTWQATVRRVAVSHT